MRISSGALDWIKKSPPKSSFKRLFLETRLLLVPIMRANTKNPLEGLKDSECKRGNIINWPPIPYVQPVDPNEKQEKTKLKVKLPDGTNYQMVPFRARTNEDFITHIITMKQLLEQKEIENDVEKAFGVVTAIRNNMLGPLYKKLNMSKVNVEKEELKKQIDSVKEDVLKAEREAQGERSSRPTS